MERRVRTKYGTIARVNWHRDGLVGVTHLTDSPDGLKFEGLSNVYREDEVEFLDSSTGTLSDLRQWSDDQLREHLIALRRQRREVQQRPQHTRSRPTRDDATALLKQIAALSPEERQALRSILKGGDPT